MSERATIEALTEALDALTTEENRDNARILLDALSELELARKALKAWELWEADLILCQEAWMTSDGLPHLTLALYDKWCNEPGCLQQLRNEAMYGTPTGMQEAKP